MKNRFEQLRQECPIIAILRGVTPEEVEAVCDTLYENGIFLVEITLNSDRPLASIELAVRHCADRMMVGAGTVLTAEQVRQVKAAGGQFIISPNTDADVIRTTKECGMISIPGFFTPTEGFTALKAGADYLKLFPAFAGPTYVKDLKAVIKAPIMAVGGVGADNLTAFMKVCAGAGIGSSLYKAGKSLSAIAEDARKLVACCRAAQ